MHLQHLRLAVSRKSAELTLQPSRMSANLRCSHLECLQIYAAAISKICDFLDGLAFAMPTLKEEEANFHVNMKLSFSSFNCRCEILDIQVFNKLRVFFDEFSSWFYFVAHEGGEGEVQFG